MHYSSEQLVIFFAFLPILLAAVTGAVRFKKLDTTLKILACLVFFAFAIESLSRIYWLYKTSNLFLWPIYITVEFALLLWMFSSELNIKLLTRACIPIILAFTSYMIYKTLQVSNEGVMIDNSGRLIESVTLLLLIMLYYGKLYKNQPSGKLWTIPMFSISTGLLLFFSGNFLIFLFINFMLQYSQKLNYQVWMIHALLNGLLYLTYTYSLWKTRAN
ncbi:hypothetical protein [Dyadobacter sp. CY312]|uniref:hypothetical protein n=1 Tax=Dyadobacter sp. CY312 TaxID=2907303 RepID=UPI001F3240D3|nr:hypothetical protein [Dyadobacter sp. CY312]MCE7039728.1 hypothetical protein [Dyadobacter sp. CY312]